MVNIREILKEYGVEIPEDKKSDFDKAIIANYKTVAEVDKLKGKLEKAEEKVNELTETLDTTNNAFEELKSSNASKEDWEKKYNDLVADNKKKAEEKERLEIEAQERAEFDKYFEDNKKEWNNPFIADGYFGKFKEAKVLDENKGKMAADILHELTKDDATAFKTTQPIVTLKGAAGGLNDADIDDAKVNAIMGIRTE